MSELQSEFKIGEINRLIAARVEPQGMYLRGEDPFEQVLLPNAYVADDLKVGDELDVFVYHDNEGRITATTLKPKIFVNDFAPLLIEQVNSMGAFADMGIVKQLMIPYGEQALPLEEGRTYVIYMYIDNKTGRLVGSTKLNRYLDNSTIEVEEKEEVDLLVLNPTDLGVNVIVNKIHKGLIFKDDIHQPLKYGDQLKGYIKTVRPDNKLDVVLQPLGVDALEPNAEKLLEILKRSEGFLDLHDKSDPEEIKKRLLMSKKAFKKAVGNLYKNKKILLVDGGIKLNN